MVGGDLRTIVHSGTCTSSVSSYLREIYSHISVHYLSTQIFFAVFRSEMLVRELKAEDNNCGIGSENIRYLAVALPKCQTLRRIDLGRNQIADEEMAELIRAMVEHANLTALHSDSNNLGKMGCKALGGLLENGACKVKELYLGSNDIDDKCVATITAALVKNQTVTTISLGRSQFYSSSFGYGKINPITGSGWRVFSSVLSSANRWENLDAVRIFDPHSNTLRME